MRLVWSPPALAQLETLAQRAPAQAGAVVAAMEWMAGLQPASPALGRRVRGSRPWRRVRRGG